MADEFNPESAGAWRRLRNAWRSWGKRWRNETGNATQEYRDLFAPVKTVQPKRNGDAAPEMALDSCMGLADSGLIYGGLYPGMERVITPFMGYYNLSLLRTCRVMELIFTGYAQDMTSNMVQLTANGDNVTDEQRRHVTELAEIAEDKYKLSSFFCDMLKDKLFWDGGCLIQPIIDGYRPDGETVFNWKDDKQLKRDTLLGFEAIDAALCSCVAANWIDPLGGKFYVPTKWNVYGQTIDASNFLWMRQNKLPYTLLPAYNYFGIPLAQTIYPYVCAFEEARISLVDIISNHRLLILKTPMNQFLKSGCQDTAGVRARAEEFADQRDNDGIVLINSEGNEDLIQINTPLSQLAELGSLNFELVAMVARRPVTKLFGTPPRGFNATGRDDVIFDNQHINGMKNSLIANAVIACLEMIQMSEYGYIDENITYDFDTAPPKLEEERMALRSQTATTDDVYIRNGIVGRVEVRQRLSTDPNSGYTGIDPAKLPDEEDRYVEQDDGDVYQFGRRPQE